MRGGQVVAKTGELALTAAQVHNLKSTILHRMGLDQERLTYRHMGRGFRLADFAGRMLDTMLA